MPFPASRKPRRFFAGEIEIEPTPPRLDQWLQQYAAYDLDFADVRGQEMAKRAITIAADGHHHGASPPPCAGRVLVARRVTGLFQQDLRR